MDDKDREAGWLAVQIVERGDYAVDSPMGMVLALAKRALRMEVVGYRVRIRQRLGGVAWSGWSDWELYGEMPDCSEYDHPVEAEPRPLYAEAPDE